MEEKFNKSPKVAALKFRALFAFSKLFVCTETSFHVRRVLTARKGRWLYFRLLNLASSTLCCLERRDCWGWQARIQDFGQGRPSGVLTQGGGVALSPKFAQNRGFPLKLLENCMILKKSWGPGGARAPRAPLVPLLYLLGLDDSLTL